MNMEDRPPEPKGSSLDPVFEKWNERLRTLGKEEKHAEEYGQVLVVHRWLDENLTAAIKSQFVPNTKTATDSLFKYPGGLSNFSSRVFLGRCMGVFGPTTYADLRIINDIRNGFAHPRKGESGGLEILGFEGKVIETQCNKLAFLNSTGFYLPKATRETVGKDRFFRTVGTISANLWHFYVMPSEASLAPKDLEEAEKFREIRAKMLP